MLRDVHPLRHAVWGSQGGLVGLPLRGVRAFGQFAWLEVGSGKMALPRPGRAPGWCPIPPTGTPTGHNADRWADIDMRVRELIFS